MFVGAHKNCIFPVEWQEFLEPPDKAQILLWSTTIKSS
jgi:hypothetical protein